MQIITISGFLSRDAEQRQTQKGDSVTSLNIPVKQGWGDNETTNWFRANVWGKRADFAGKMTKGTFLVVTGELSIGEYNGKPQYEIRVNDFHSAPSGKSEGRSEAKAQSGNDWGSDEWNEDAPF